MLNWHACSMSTPSRDLHPSIRKVMITQSLCFSVRRSEPCKTVPTSNDPNFRNILNWKLILRHNKDKIHLCEWRDDEQNPGGGLKSCVTPKSYEQILMISDTMLQLWRSVTFQPRISLNFGTRCCAHKLLGCYFPLDGFLTQIITKVMMILRISTKPCQKSCKNPVWTLGC